MHTIISRTARDHGRWDRLAQANPVYLSAGWLAFSDADGVADSRYLVRARDGVPRVALPAHQSPAEPHHRYQPDTVLGGAPKTTLTFGGRRGYLSAVSSDCGLSQSDVESDLAELIVAAQEELGADDWWWPYLPGDSAVVVAAAARRAGMSVQAHLVAADYVIDVTGVSLDDHIAALATRSRRQNFRYEARAFATSSLSIRQVDIAEYATDLAALLHNVTHKYGTAQTKPQLAAYLHGQTEYLAEHAVCFVCFDGDTPIAFALSLQWGDTLYSRAVGFDYPRLPGVGEYAQLSVHQNLRHCYEHGLRTLHLGLTAGRAKCSRGAYARPLWAITSRPQLPRDNAAAIAADVSPTEAAAFAARVRLDQDRLRP